MTAYTRSWPLPVLISISLAVGGICFVMLTHFLHVIIIPCTDTWAGNLILSLTLVFVLQTFLAPKLLPNHYRSFLTIHAGLILLAFWLGLYSISPLGYSTGRIANLRGFLIVRANRSTIIANRETIALPQGSVVGISPLMLSGKFNCTWTSTTGGQLDLPSTCDIVYVPPDAEYDILRLRIRASCGLPDSTGQIKVSVIP